MNDYNTYFVSKVETQSQLIDFCVTLGVCPTGFLVRWIEEESWLHGSLGSQPQ